jgi:uncharacterized LabA/DUF88 family protein
MNRAIFFIDGFNLYHSLIENPNYVNYKWLNLRKLSECFVTRNTIIEDIFYFTALTTWNQEKVKRHQLYIKTLGATNVNIIYGKFKRKTRLCRNCHTYYPCHEEKQTDVNIAIKLLILAFENRYDTAYIISGDSDLIPSIHTVQNNFPNKKICIITPIGRSSIELKQIADMHMKIKEKHLITSLFPKEIVFQNGEKIICPSTWINPIYHT